MEGLGRKTEDDVLCIEKLDQVCPRLRELTLSVFDWSEGGGEDNSSHLRRQVRALSKPSCALAGRLRQLELSILDPSEVPTIKLGKLLSAAVQLQVLVLCGVALGGFPRSATGPPSLTSLTIAEGDVCSFLPLIQATPTFTELTLSLNMELDPLLHGVKALDEPHVGVAALHLESIVQRAGTIDDPTTIYQNINAFIACFPNITTLGLDLSGQRLESTGIDLDALPRQIQSLIVEDHEEEGEGDYSHDSAAPSLAELEAWIRRGGAPRLKMLHLSRRDKLSKQLKRLLATSKEREIDVRWEPLE